MKTTRRRVGEGIVVADEILVKLISVSASGAHRDEAGKLILENPKAEIGIRAAKDIPIVRQEHSNVSLAV